MTLSPHTIHIHQIVLENLNVSPMDVERVRSIVRANLEHVLGNTGILEGRVTTWVRLQPTAEPNVSMTQSAGELRLYITESVAQSIDLASTKVKG